MGKGNRSRQDRAFETVNTTVEATPKNTKLITTITTIAVSLLLVGCILLSVVVSYFVQEPLQRPTTSA